jgi:hypothetical protein
LAKDWQPAALGAIVESMKYSRDELQKLATTFRTSTWQPPQMALCAFASLLAEEALTQAIGETFTAESRTVWVLTGTTYTSLIRVRASSTRDGWSWQEPGSKDQQRGEDLAATRWPLSAVRSLNVARVSGMTARGDSAFEWEADWVLTLPDGETISLPASRVTPSQAEADRVESLIAAIRWRM